MTKDEFLAYFLAAEEEGPTVGGAAAPPRSALSGRGIARRPSEPPAEVVGFARGLLRRIIGTSEKQEETDAIILESSPAKDVLPKEAYHWPAAPGRPHQTLLFELDRTSAQLLEESAFGALRREQRVEDVLHYLLQRVQEGFAKGGEKRTAEVKGGKATETLMVVAVRDDLRAARGRVNVVCFGTVAATTGLLESFTIRDEARHWAKDNRAVAERHVERLYDRHFSKLAGEAWQDAFVTGEQRDAAESLLETFGGKSPKASSVVEAAKKLIREVGQSFRVGGTKDLVFEELRPDHYIGADPIAASAATFRNDLSGLIVRDRSSRVLGYVVYCLTNHRTADKLRARLREHNAFDNVLLIAPENGGAKLELWQGNRPLEERLRKDGATFDGVGKVVNLLSRFFVVSQAQVRDAKDLAEQLAKRARYLKGLAKRQLEAEGEKGPLRRLFVAFQRGLVADLDEAGFADAFAQTVANGLLTARWANRATGVGADQFTVTAALKAIPVTNPFLRGFFEKLDELRGAQSGGLYLWMIEDIASLLERVDVTHVFDYDPADEAAGKDPVIHFFEDFLAAYDAKQRMQRGVFYTPRPVVSYIVRSVHELLRAELGLEDGLADEATWGDMAARHPKLTLPDGVSPKDRFVNILDPATGTGTFLVEAIDVIHRTRVAKWNREGLCEEEIDARWNAWVPDHLLPRLHGYELLMAPYAIAHLKIGLKLHETGYRFGSQHRARVFLTNALEPAHDVSSRFDFAIPALATEVRTVNDVKRDHRFTVVIANPPYAGHSVNNQVEWIVDKVYDYKRGYPDLQKAGQAKWLQDDYVKFLRFAEHQIERSGVGVVGYITNHAWYDNPTFKGMRRHVIGSFHAVRVLDLHGNANKKEKAADGSADENVFEIKQGVGVTLLSLRAAALGGLAKCHRADLLGTEKAKLDALRSSTSATLGYVPIEPIEPECIFAALDRDLKDEYVEYVSLPALMDRSGDPAPGIVTTHDEFAISFTKAEQIEKVEALLGTRTEAEARKLFKLCSQSQWNYAVAKKELARSEWRKLVVRVLYRPFDTRYTVYDRQVAVHLRKRASKHMIGCPNVALVLVRQVAEGVFTHALVTDSVVDNRITSSNKGIAFLFPLWLAPEGLEKRTLPNIAPTCTSVVGQRTGLRWTLAEGDGGRLRERGDLLTGFGPRDLFDWVYAILHSPAYRARYADFLKSDFARVPLPPSAVLFRELARLGGQLVELHLLESKALASGGPEYEGSRRPEVGRVGWADDTVWIDAARTQASAGHRAAKAGSAGFHGVREEAWDFHIGGYQVLHKWLKDRQGRTLSAADIEHYRKMVVAITETIRLMREIDEVIAAHGGWPGAFKTEARP